MSNNHNAGQQGESAHGCDAKCDNRMRLLVGLGNPGSEYAQTRHNIGFMVVDRFAQHWPGQKWRAKFSGDFAEVVFEDRRLGLLKPTTYMNVSGLAVRQVMDFYKLDLESLLVVTDDMALAPGRLRLRRSGSPGGHNGLASISEHLGTEDFARMRIGIGRNNLPDSVDYVLGRFSKEQWPPVNDAVDQAVQALGSWLRHGIELTMNKFNAPRNAPEDSQGQ